MGERVFCANFHTPKEEKRRQGSPLGEVFDDWSQAPVRPEVEAEFARLFSSPFSPKAGTFCMGYAELKQKHSERTRPHVLQCLFPFLLLRKMTHYASQRMAVSGHSNRMGPGVEGPTSAVGEVVTPLRKVAPAENASVTT